MIKCFIHYLQSYKTFYRVILVCFWKQTWCPLPPGVLGLFLPVFVSPRVLWDPLISGQRCAGAAHRTGYKVEQGRDRGSRCRWRAALSCQLEEGCNYTRETQRMRRIPHLRLSPPPHPLLHGGYLSKFSFLGSSRNILCPRPCVLTKECLHVCCSSLPGVVCGGLCCG